MSNVVAPPSQPSQPSQKDIINEGASIWTRVISVVLVFGTAMYALSEHSAHAEFTVFPAGLFLLAVINLVLIFTSKSYSAFMTETQIARNTNVYTVRSG